ncbi:hypothetical protein HZA39_01380 [Candidatus Peregrinibacteria bacterium]|nr:hypothetical protein [Candidatus Peregrinibacteria bacterium]
MHKYRKHIHIAAILLSCLIIAAAAIVFIKGSELKGLIASPSSESEKVCDQSLFNISENGAVIVYGSLPCFGTRVEQKIANGAVIARFKIFNNSARVIDPIKNIKIKNNGFHANTNVKYKLMLSSENSADYEAETIAVSATDLLNFATLNKEFTISPASYRYLSVAIVSGAGLSQGDIFCLQLISLGDLKMKNTPVLGCAIIGDGGRF